jgi:hypothetical protein
MTTNRHDAVGSNRTMTCRPREHQDFEDRHEFIGPKQTCQSECKNQLDDETRSDNIHGNTSTSWRFFYWNVTEAFKESY